MNIDVPSTTETGQAKTATHSPNRFDQAAALILVFVGLAGLAYLAARLAFGFAGSVSDTGSIASWMIDACLLLAFGLQHSGMARDGWKRQLPPHWQRAVYVGASGLASVLLACGWRPLPGETWWALSDPWGVVLTACRGIALMGMTVCVLRMDLIAFLGLRPFWPKRTNADETLDVLGPYRFVRHPLMAFFLAFLWARPMVSSTYGWLAVGITAYVLLGIYLEEQGLRRQFGEAYEAYRRRTPMLLPWKGVVQRSRASKS